MFVSFKETSLAKKAIDKALITVNTVDFREFATNKHRKVDDYPFGGGAGMLLMPQPLFDCFDSLEQSDKSINIYMSPSGSTLNQSKVEELSGYTTINILCGHYEGVDNRVIEKYIDEEISIGDYILTGGEICAMVLIDCIMRYIPGVLSNEESTQSESFCQSLLEYPQYTRPSKYENMCVPEVLISGNHKKIEEWQREQSLIKTLKNRPDLLKKANLTKKDIEFLEKLREKP